ncbi:MAG: hypothetical protein AAF493_24935 [Pseudomonadota bacterium]
MSPNLTAPGFSALSRLANRVLELDLDTRAALEKLGVVVVACGDERLGVTVIAAHGGIELTAFESDYAHVRTEAGPITVLRYLFSNQPPSLDSLKISGDGERLEALAQVLRRLDLDWEEAAAQWVGDTGAHVLGRMARDIESFFRQGRDSIAQRIGDYVAYESDLSVSQPEFAAFAYDVGRLDRDVASLAERLNRLRAASGDSE